MKPVLGHERIQQQIRQALVKNQLASSLLFIGPEGVGKWTMAKKLAQSIVCSESHVEACGHCASCVQMYKGQHPAVHTVNTDAAQIRIDDAREILKKLTLKNWEGPRVVLVNDAHKLNPQASNALLKIIEEPPEQTHFILVTSQPKKILSTIRSRTQVMRFGPLSQQHLAKITGASGWQLSSANGSVTRVEQLQHSESQEVRVSALRTFVDLFAPEKTYLQWMDSMQNVVKDKESLDVMFSTWMQMLRDMCVQDYKDPIHSDLMVELSQISVANWNHMYEVFQVIAEMQNHLQSNVDRQLLLESGFLKVRECLQYPDEVAI